MRGGETVATMAPERRAYPVEARETSRLFATALAERGIALGDVG